MFRPRRQRLFTTDHLFFVTVNVYQRTPIFRDPRWAILFLKILDGLHQEGRFSFYEYVIMPDHYHAIIAPRKSSTITEVMRRIHGRFANVYNKLSGHVGQVFQHRFYDHVIRNDADYHEKALYIRANPIRAGLVQAAEEYPWTSARNRYHHANPMIPVDDVP